MTYRFYMFSRVFFQSLNSFSQYISPILPRGNKTLERIKVNWNDQRWVTARTRGTQDTSPWRQKESGVKTKCKLSYIWKLNFHVFLGKFTLIFASFQCMTKFNTNKKLKKIIWTIFCCLFAYLVILNWMPNLVNFTLLGARYFFIPINTLELYSEMWFSLERQFIWGLTFKTS